MNLHEDSPKKKISKCLLSSRRARTPQSRQSSKEDRPHARHPDLRMGKREGRGEEAVR